MAAVALHLRRYGDLGPRPLLLLHGLFGAGANWHGIARRLAGQHPVLVPDLRNHGASPHDPVMTYAAMAEDLSALLEREAVERTVVVGHSMGGKAAMWLALTRPERIEAVVVVDIAPVTYPGGFETPVEALLALPLNDVSSRADADRRLAATIPDASIRGYLLQNLRRCPDRGGKAWAWRTNLPFIAAALPEIRGFPKPAERQFPGPALFLYGTASDYIGAQSLPAIRQLFPLARLRAVANAGHWVYAEQPDAFSAALASFLGRL